MFQTLRDGFALKPATDQTFPAKVGRVFSTYGGTFLYVMFFLFILQVTGIFSKIPEDHKVYVFGAFSNFLLRQYHLTLAQALEEHLGLVLFMSCVAAPLIEEIVFRGAICSALADKNGKVITKGIMAILAWSFVVFGIAHGNGYFSVMLQGVGGLFLARLWFINTGKSLASSYFSCVVVHSMYNFTVVAITLLQS